MSKDLKKRNYILPLELEMCMRSTDVGTCSGLKEVSGFEVGWSVSSLLRIYSKSWVNCKSSKQGVFWKQED